MSVGESGECFCRAADDAVTAYITSTTGFVQFVAAHVEAAKGPVQEGSPCVGGEIDSEKRQPMPVLDVTSGS